MGGFLIPIIVGLATSIVGRGMTQSMQPQLPQQPQATPPPAPPTPPTEVLETIGQGKGEVVGNKDGKDVVFKKETASELAASSPELAKEQREARADVKQLTTEKRAERRRQSKIPTRGNITKISTNSKIKTLLGE